MATLRMDAAAVRAGAVEVLEGAARLDEMRWPTMDSGALVGSDVERATAGSAAEDRLATVVARMRAWTGQVLASVAELEHADESQVSRLGAPR